MSGFLLDTNIPSELLRPRPDVTVAGWLNRQSRETLFVSLVTLGELRRGIALLNERSARRLELQRLIVEKVPSWFHERIMDVTASIAERWGMLDAERQIAGRPLNMAAGLIAATALEHDLTVVTRNVKDFTDLGVAVFNPWEADRRPAVKPPLLRPSPITE
jgi:toxin FitB